MARTWHNRKISVHKYQTGLTVEAGIYLTYNVQVKYTSTVTPKMS